MYQDSHRIPRRTKIIFTIGPATDSEEMLESLIGEHFVDICRINMAHASHDYVRTVVRRIRKVGERLAERAKAAGIDSVVFDRGGNRYVGRVAALADAARSGGLDF